MLIERSDFIIRDGEAAAFTEAMAQRGLPILQAVTGVESLQFGRGVERPEAFTLMVGWTSLDAHHAYNATPACQEIRALIGGFATSGAMEHFEMQV